MSLKDLFVLRRIVDNKLYKYPGRNVVKVLTYRQAQYTQKRLAQKKIECAIIPLEEAKNENS